MLSPGIDWVNHLGHVMLQSAVVHSAGAPDSPLTESGVPSAGAPDPPLWTTCCGTESMCETCEV